MSSSNGKGNPLAKQVGGAHYNTPIQSVQYIVANGLGFCEGCVVKYVTRHRRKGGEEDLRKAIHYLELLIELEYTHAEKPAPKREPPTLSPRPVEPVPLLHILRSTFDRHEMDVEKHTAGNIIDALQRSGETNAADMLTAILARENLTRSLKLGPLFRLFVDGEVECKSCGG